MSGENMFDITLHILLSFDPHKRDKKVLELFQNQDGGLSWRLILTAEDAENVKFVKMMTASKADPKTKVWWLAFFKEKQGSTYIFEGSMEED